MSTITIEPTHIMLKVAETLAMPHELYSTPTRYSNKASDMRTIAAMYIRLLCPEIPLKAIGYMFGGRKHSTIVHNCIRGYERLQYHDTEFIEMHTMCGQALTNLNQAA